ncbi:TetR-like C-terminal domain-containing protein [Actinokineospora bangkokensis]|uniref:TetR family transcriptional regulator n=1 Tax=Actinokineospora bangkokensis TaxID=1193682 RepID=A0A1Q9LNX0_9PSEU|nr:TetR/AcrR family transcriptional regulator [Actinokineospora bangkokensis]OLR93720.1 TetR family transcriptional regulator [Actinokineospora bangkokensis]
MSPAQDEVRRRPGGRSAKVRAAVLRATLDALAELGPDAVSISEVARRADVHATSIQRRWGSRDKLVLDAMLTHSQEQLPIPDTGTARGDLIAFARLIRSYLATPLGGALARVMAATEDDPAPGRAEFWRSRYDSASAIVDRGVARGELAAGTDPRQALELLIAPLHFRLLLTRQPLGDDDLERLADAVVRSFAAQGLS